MNKKTVLLLIFITIAACAVLLCGCIRTVASSAPTAAVSATAVDRANYALVDVGDAVEVSYSDLIGAGTAPSGGNVRTAAEFAYMLHDTGKTSYTLCNDFFVTAGTWNIGNYMTDRAMTINGAYTEQVLIDGVLTPVEKKHRITYAPNLEADTTELCRYTHGGFFSVFKGKMDKVQFVFRGKLEVDMISFSTSSSIIYYGGLAGVLQDATFTDCEISQSGSITCYANSTERTMFVGGIAGYMDKATFSNCTLSVAGSISAASFFDNETDSVESSRGNINYAGGIAAVTVNNTTFSGCVIKASGTITTSDSAVNNDKTYNSDDHILPAGGMFAVGASVTIDSCDITIGGRVNASASQYSSVNGAIAGGMFGIAGAYEGNKSILLIQNNTINLSCTVSAVTNREKQTSSWFGLVGEDVSGGNAFNGGIVGRFNETLHVNSLFKQNAILYYATIEKSAKYGTDGKSFYGYLCGNNPTAFNTWNKGNIWTVLDGDDKTTTITVRQSTDDSGSASNACGDIGVLMVFGGGKIKAEVEGGKLQFSANQVYSPFDNWYSEIEGPTLYTRSAYYKTGEVFTQTKEDVNGNPYTKYVFAPKNGGKTVNAVFLTKEINSAGTFVQWTEEMNSGLNKSWIVVNLTKDITVEEKYQDYIFVTKGVNIVNEFNGTFNGNGKTITFQNGVEMVGVANFTDDEINSIFGDGKAGEGVTAAGAGIFRVIGSNAIVRNFNLVFAGKMYAGTYSDTPVESYVAAGFLAGVNYGTISDINLTVPQAGNLIAVSKAEAYGGGLVGIDKAGSITNVTASIQGNYSIKSLMPVLGGVIGKAETSDTKTYSDFNINVKGQLESYGNASSAGNSYSAGFVGYCTGKLSLRNVIVNVQEKSNMGGDVLVNNCKHNILLYEEIVSDLNKFYVASGSVSDLEDIADDVNELGVGSSSVADLRRLKNNIAYAIAKLQANERTTWDGIDAEYWFNENVKDLSKTLDCNATCSTCISNAKRAYFVAAHGGVGLAQVWAIGSYNQFAGLTGSYNKGANYISYFGIEQNVDALVASDYGLNLIYVRNGTAEGTFSEDGIRFVVPLEDSAHVFTGWYVDYDHTTMVSGSLLKDNAFFPGDQAGGVWYSRVINSMITTADEISVLSTTTNAGQSYNAVTFTLGNDIKISGTFSPIGTELHPFMGTFDGKGYSVEINGLNTAYSALGLFGCLGNAGTVKQVTVKINSLDNLRGKVFGAVVGVNYGTVGQNSQNERVRAEIYCSTNGAGIAGGIVGKNMLGGLVFNTESYLVGLLTANNIGSGSFTAAGGVVGYNEGSVRNVKVTCAVADEDEYDGSISTYNTTAAAYAGGLVGANVGALYSGVVEVFFDESANYIAKASANTATNAFSAILVGFNNSSDIDSLWAVYQLDTIGFATPYDNPLINGVKSDVGNRLVRYGYGSVSTEIYANTETQVKGGNILFAAVEDPSRAVPFYSYTKSLDHGEQVAEAAGSNYTPAIGTLDTSGLSGVTYYAVFADAEINSDAEYYNLVSLVNRGYRAYVNYILRLTSVTSLVLRADDVRYQSLGARGKAFVGSFDGSGKNIELKCETQDYETVPLFGVIGETSEVRNFSFTIESTLCFTGGYTYDSKSVAGGFAYVNLGKISYITYKFQSGIYGDASYANGCADYAGAFVGYNAGQISDVTVSLNSSDIASSSKVARVYGMYAGGIAGYNAPTGWIGSNAVSSVILAVNTGTVPASIIGILGAGGLVGDNRGRISNAAVSVSGLIGSPEIFATSYRILATEPLSEHQVTVVDSYVTKPAELCAVGGIAGINAGIIYGTRATIQNKATLRAKDGYLGGLVGKHEGGMIGDSEEEDSVKVYLQSAIDADCPAYLGGIAGYSAARIDGVYVSFESNAFATRYIGGAIGYNTHSVSNVELIIRKDVLLANIVSPDTSYTGGAIGYNTGELHTSKIYVYGVLGQTGGGIVGGFVGYTSGVVYDSFVMLHNTIVSSRDKGLAAGGTAEEYVYGEPKNYGDNAWAVAFNSDRSLASVSDNSGFNVLKIVGTEMVTPSMSKSGMHVTLRFQSTVVTSNLAWYTDISKLEKYESETGTNNTLFVPNAEMYNCLYHVCAYDLEIDNVDDLVNIYTFVNSADLFNGVMFRLVNDISVKKGYSMQPIGSVNYPFTGIFEGNGHTIAFRTGSIIVGSEVSGVFGVIAEGAIVRNFILQVEKDVLIGSSTDCVGALAGYINGSVEDVAINLLSAPRSSKDGAKVGALAGQAAAGARFSDVWVINYNRAVARAVGNDLSSGDYNVIDVYGRGEMRIERWSSTGENSRFQISIDQEASYFDNWYSDFATSTVFSDGAGIGRFGVTADAATQVVVAAWYRPDYNKTGCRFTASFIKMVITSAQDFYNFASNINDFGVPDGQFRFELPDDKLKLEIDLSKMQPIGNAKYPFQATLDGTVTKVSKPDSYAYTLVLKGAIQDADYSGLFGYIGEGAVIRNLIITADSAETQSIGHTESIYTGFFAGYIQGGADAGKAVTLENIVVSINAQTTLRNSHSDAIGVVAGLWGNHIDANNVWAVLLENGAYRALGSSRVGSSVEVYTEGMTGTSSALPNTMYLCGDGSIYYAVKRSAVDTSVYDVFFKLVSENYYGFIEKTQMSVDTGALSTEKYARYGEHLNGKVYLALYIQTKIFNSDDLAGIAHMVNVDNRNYLGVTFTLENDITLSADFAEKGWMPIGGAVETYAGSGEYKQVGFIGAFDGNGHTITIPGDFTCSAQFAGIFGILADTARVRNVKIVVRSGATIGSASTQYAGILAGVDQGAELSNIIVDIGQNTTLRANMVSSRVAVNQALTYDVNGVVTNYDSVRKANNVWVLERNSRYSSEQNNAEQSFYDSVDGKWSGKFNGGVNVVTIIANGTITVDFGATYDNIEFAVSGKEIKKWYSVKNKVMETYEYGNAFVPAASVKGCIIYASFVDERISTQAALIELSRDVAEGCDLYGQTFYLENDVVITDVSEDGFVPIGTLVTPFTGTFNGLGNTITLASSATIGGEIAGIFGVLGADGTICNLKLSLEGTLGSEDATQYAAAIAVNYGTLRSVIIDATRLIAYVKEVEKEPAEEGGETTERVLTEEEKAALPYASAFSACDYNNNHSNVWLIVGADNPLASFGYFRGDSSTVNVMRVIGMGRLASEFVMRADPENGDKYYVRMFNDETYTQSINVDGDDTDLNYTVRGWYSDYSADNQLSKALNVTALDSNIVAGDHGSYLAAADIYGRSYEVAIMSRTIVSQEDLIAISHDVNVGGYTFENTTFTLGHDVTITSSLFEPIASAKGSVFLGTFQGAYNGEYYKIIMDRHVIALNGEPQDQGVSLFGNVRGVIENLIVDVNVAIPSDSHNFGVIAATNEGVVRNCLIRIQRAVTGAVIGGVVSNNTGSVSNCIVYLTESASLTATSRVGGLIGENEGSVLGSTFDQVETWKSTAKAYALLSAWYDKYGDEITLSSVIIEGTVGVVNSTDESVMFVGGAIGVSQKRASVSRVTVRIFDNGAVYADCANAEVGGLIGRNHATLANSVVIAGNVDLDCDSVYATASGAYCGYFVGDLQGTAFNSWLVVPVPPTVKSIGNGSSINVLQINGEGDIDVYMDASNNIIFRNITREGGAELDGWYVNSGIQVPDDIGGVDAVSFRPNRVITGYTINVVFINTIINSVDDLVTMAKTVNAGLFSMGLNFTLTTDLNIDVATSLLFRELTIGTAVGDNKNAFKHTFDGLGHTITIYNGNKNEVIGTNMGLFGYTGQDAVIRNLNLVIQGYTFGAVGTTDVFGGIVCENNGVIENCNVYFGCHVVGTDVVRYSSIEAGAARFIAAKVGGIAGENFGTIRSCKVYSYAALHAEAGAAGDRSDYNQYAGAVVGNNRGTITEVDVYLNQPFGYDALSAVSSVGNRGTAYVGGVAGNNAIEVSKVYIELNEASIVSNSGVAYSGGVCGSNTGYVRNAYIVFNKSYLSSTLSAGGIVGTNNNNLADILIDYLEGSALSADVDSAVEHTGHFGTSVNVWVFNHDQALNSHNALINSMTQRSAAVDYSASNVIGTGTIIFDAALDAVDGLTVYADADTSFTTVRLDDFITYNGNKLRLASNDAMQRVHVRSEIRRSIADQSELKAIAFALSEGKTVSGTYTLAADITVDGVYLPIGNGTPFAATLSGGMHTVTFTEDVTFDGGYAAMFDVMNGIVQNVVLRYQRSVDAGICRTNNGYIGNVVIYTDYDVVLTNPTYNNGEPRNKNGEIWIVSREDGTGSSAEAATNRYGFIMLHGNGTLDVVLGDGEELIFTASPANDVTTFAGYSNGTKMLSIERVGGSPESVALSRRFSTKIAVDTVKIMTYTAEFLKREIATSTDFRDLLGLLDKEYSVDPADSYYLAADITVDAETLGSFAAFTGTLNGNYYTLKVAGKKNQAFGSFNGILQNIVLDCTDLDAKEPGEEDSNYYLFSNSAEATLTRVAIRRGGSFGYLQYNNKLTLGNVYVVSADPQCARPDNVGLIVYTDAPVTFKGSASSMEVEAEEADGKYFVGWYESHTLDWSASATDIIRNRGSKRITLSETKTYVARYLSAELQSKDDFASLSCAVSFGLDFEGDVFTVTQDIDDVDTTIGSAFLGKIEGKSDQTIKISMSDYLFDRFVGKLSHLVIESSTAKGIAREVRSGAEIDNVVVVSHANDACYADSIDRTAEMDNCWLVTYGDTPVEQSSVKIIKVLRHIDLSITVTEADGVVFTTKTINDSGEEKNNEYFLLWRDKTDLIVNEDYNVLDSAKAKGTYYIVTASDTVSSDEEYAAFAIATAYGYSGSAMLATDIHIGIDTPTMTHVFKLNGNGHTIYYDVPVAIAVLSAESDENCYIYNAVFIVPETIEKFLLVSDRNNTGKTCELSNIVVKSSTSVDLSGCVLDNVWVLYKNAICDDMVTAYQEQQADASAPIGIYDGKIICDKDAADRLNVLLYDKGEISVGFDFSGEKPSMVAIVDEDDALHFLGYKAVVNHTETQYALEGAKQRVQAFFADKELDSSEKWTHAARAMALSGKTDLTFTLTADIEADDDFVPFEAFSGELNGAFYSVIVRSTAAFTLASGANVHDLAVEIMDNSGFDATERAWFDAPAGATVTNCVLVNYNVRYNPDHSIKALTHHENARLITVSDQNPEAGEKGSIRVDKSGNKFLFVPNNLPQYSLRYYVMGGVNYDVDAAEVFAAEETRDLIAKFEYCYTVYVEIVGVPAELVKETNLTASRFYWIGDAYTDAVVEFKDSVQGYLFKGFEFDSAAITRDGTREQTKLNINVAALTSSVTVKAVFVLINYDWETVVYGDKTPQEMDAYLVPAKDVKDVIDSNAKYKVIRMIFADSDVKYDSVSPDFPDVDAPPVHAGSYVIYYDIYYGSILVGSSDGLSFNIEKRELYFESLRVNTKKYDNKADANVYFAYTQLGGFAPRDMDADGRCKESYSISSTVKLKYYDALTGEDAINAGTWTLRVDEGSTIMTTLLNGEILFNDDYCLPKGELYIYAKQADGSYVKTGNKYQATIAKQDLDLVVKDISINYLDQFGKRDGSGNLIPFNIYDYITLELIGMVEGSDSEILSNESEKLKLLRVKGDSIVDGTYVYTIRYPGTYDIEVNKDVLQNYEPKISENKATFTILASSVSISLSGMEMQYGDTLTSLNYVIQASDAVTSFSAEEKATVRSKYSNLDAADWFAVDLVPESALIPEGDAALAQAFNTVSIGRYGVRYRFVATNKSFMLDAAMISSASVRVVFNADNQEEYVISQLYVDETASEADRVLLLSVTRREIVYNITSGYTKLFGAETGVIGGRSIGKPLMNSDKLVFTKAKGETVGTYAIEVTVVDPTHVDEKGNPIDVTDNYILKAYKPVSYVIEKRTVVVQRTGNGIFSYGSESLQNMPCAVNLSDKVKTNILTNLNLSRSGITFEEAFILTVGVDSSEQPVGKYSNATLTLEYDDIVNAAIASENLEFVLDSRSKNYEIIRASLTVSAIEVVRPYDMTDTLYIKSASNPNGVGITVSGWVNGDDRRLSVRVGKYVCNDLTRDAGTYLYVPTDLSIISLGAGGDSVIDNYTIGKVISANYTITRVALTFDVLIGTYDDEGNFTKDEDGFIEFGDSRAQWYFGLDESLIPAYLMDEYENAELETDLQRSDWMRNHFGIVARSVASLPAKTIVTTGNNKQYYLPYSSDSNILISCSDETDFRIDPIVIIISEVRFDMESAKTEPTMTFTVNAYNCSEDVVTGEMIIGDVIKDYFDEQTVANVKSGQRVELNDNYAVSFDFTSYDLEKCNYNFSSYVNDGGDWLAYREVTSDAYLFVEQKNLSGKTELVPYTQTLTSEVVVRGGTWELIADAIIGHPVIVALSVIGVIALVAIGIVGAYLYKKRRLKDKVRREMRNQSIVDNINAQSDQAEEGDASEEDESLEEEDAQDEQNDQDAPKEDNRSSSDDDDEQ